MASSGPFNMIPLPEGGNIPLLGLGTWLSTNKEEAGTAVETAIKLGYRHIDTALAYQNEAAIGNALQRVFQSGLVKREDLFIVTKIPGNLWRRDDVKKGLKMSLTDLKLDCVDLVLIHSPFYVKGKHETDFFPVEDGKLVIDPEGDLNEMWQGMEDCVQAGMTKYIGLSNFNSQQILRILDNCKIRPVNLQVECHAYFQQSQLFDFCQKHNITMTAYGPLGAPQLPSLRPKSSSDVPESPVLMQDPTLLSLAQKYHRTPAQILLRWLTQRGVIAIPKSTKPERLEENFKVLDFKLSDADMDTIKQMDKGLRYFAYDFIQGLQEHPEFPFKIAF